MRNNISKNQSFLFSEVGCLKSNQSGALCSPFPFSKLLWEISWFSWPSRKPFSFRPQWFQRSEFCPQSTGSLLAIQICHWIANPLNRQFVVSRFPRVVRSQKITVPAKSTDFSNCFRLNSQCSSHIWEMMMVEPSWETALAKGQLPLFTMIMGQSTCNWWCDESSDMRKKHRKQRVFLSKLVNWMITGHIFGLSIETWYTKVRMQCH